MTIRVAIVDDHAIVRQGLRTLLNNMAMDVVGEASCGEDAIQLAGEYRPDVMLLDIRMKPGDGLTALPEIKAASPGTEIIILTTYANPTYLSEAIRSGACGYLLKESDPEDIIEAIQSAASQSYLFDRTLLNMVVQTNSSAHENAVPHIPVLDPEESDIIEAISDREQDVLQLMAKGMTNGDIADTLQVSITTVKTHVSHILRKLNVNDRTQAVLVAIRQGLIQ